jgi:hypothetical protein
VPKLLKPMSLMKKKGGKREKENALLKMDNSVRI